MNHSGQDVRWDCVALITFTLAAGLCYLGWWWSGYPVWFCYTTAVLAAGALSGWLRWLWPRVALCLTKFFCVAALFDLLLEGFVHPFHPETLVAKLLCQFSLFGVYAFYLGILRPIDQRYLCPLVRSRRLRIR